MLLLNDNRAHSIEFNKKRRNYKSINQGWSLILFLCRMSQILKFCFNCLKLNCYTSRGRCSKYYKKYYKKYTYINICLSKTYLIFKTNLICEYYWMTKSFNKIFIFLRWEVGSVVKRTCSCGVSGFISQHPHAGLQPSVSPVLGDQHPPLTSAGHGHCTET